MEDLKQKRAVAKSQFTRAEKSLRRLIESDDTVEEQISKRLIELSQKWQDIQDVHDEYATKVPAEQVEEEDRYIEEIEMRFEAIEKDAVVFLRKFVEKQRGSMVVNSPSNTPTSKNEGNSDAIGGQSSQASDTTPAGLNGPTAASGIVTTIDQHPVIPKARNGAEIDSVAEQPELRNVIKFEKQKLEIFEGDIRKYPGFKERFTSYIEPRYSKSEAALCLRLQLSATIRDEVENIEDDVALLWQRLDLKYGNTRKYIDTVLSDISKLSKGDGMATLNMINMVEKSYRDLVRIGSQTEMSNSFMISMIERKLPEQMRIEWVKLVAEQGVTDSHLVFQLLMDFLAKWRKIIEYDAASIRKTSEKKIHGQTNHVSGTKQRSQNKSDVCWVHESGNHPVWKCKIFQMMPLKEKLEMVKQKQACHACFETSCPGAKNPEECAKSFKCPMKGCGKPHNVLIHQQ